MALSPTPELESNFVCACAQWARSACAGEPFYQEHEGKRYCVLHFPEKEKSPDFEKALQKKLASQDFDFQGVWFPDDVSFSGFNFGGAPDFSRTTFTASADFSRAAFPAGAYFRGATFTGGADFFKTIFGTTANFVGATFSAEAVFGQATFSAEANFFRATFNAKADFTAAIMYAPAYFIEATFRAEAVFRRATFRAIANFYRGTFSAVASFSSVTFMAPAHFERTTFMTADFRSATFSSAASFSYATFSGNLNFREVTFGDYVKFAGTEERPTFRVASSLDLRFARIEKPDHLSFHTLILRPHWFINVDARKFEFTNVEWHFRLKQEIRDLRRFRLAASGHRLLAVACRHLAVNAEENHRYEDASKLRYLAMDARRRESLAGFAAWRLSWWYWLASGYGERVLKAFLVLLGIWFVAALFYTCVGFARWEPRLASESDAATARRDVIGAPLKFSRALTYSAAVMTFQRPEPRPATTAAQTVVLLETILGPVQAALLALAIRRKFMR